MDKYSLKNQNSSAYLESFNLEKIVFISASNADGRIKTSMSPMEHGHCLIEVDDVKIAVCMQAESGEIPVSNIIRAKQVLEKIADYDQYIRKADQVMRKMLVNHTNLKSRLTTLESVLVYSEEIYLEYATEEGDSYLEEIRLRA